MMVAEAIKGLNMTAISRIYVIGLSEHDERFNLVDALSDQFERLGILAKTSFILLDQQTRNQPHTIAECIRRGNIRGPVYIKDSDNFFRHTPRGDNSIAGFDLHKIEKVNARNKSYFEFNADGFVTNIVEKKIISSKFCAGGYSFDSAELYLKYFDEIDSIANGSDDVYLSHIIYKMIIDGIPFTYSEVGDYTDWGTIKEWRAFARQFATLFVDLDGTLIKNSGQYTKPGWGETPGISANIEAVNSLFDSGKVRIIITTSRTEKFKKITIDQLSRLKVMYHDIIFGLPHAKRIIINDFAPTNPYRSCDAINLRRDSDDLRELLDEVMGSSS
jgi:hypothetical protein